jgi:hypothetical protein
MCSARRTFSFLCGPRRGCIRSVCAMASPLRRCAEDHGSGEACCDLGCSAMARGSARILAGAVCQGLPSVDCLHHCGGERCGFLWSVPRSE